MSERHIVRFGRTERIQHAILIITFLGLAATGLPLRFSEAAWAPALSRLFGGFAAAGLFHRAFATALLMLFVIHVSRLAIRVLRGDRTVLWGPASMVPQPPDLRDFYQHVRWFFGRGPRPVFERFTYWEKFDYWAVFWGMTIIGGSGLLLWFPESFARLLPGWVFNVALLLHGDEALLAVGFIVTIHFTNCHLRPRKFPMDLVIFTGTVTETELRHDRRAEYDRLVRTGQLDALAVEGPDPATLRRARIAGALGLTIGIGLVALIVYAVL
jgi:cytochrome b subunit of formate dehydrogenase